MKQAAGGEMLLWEDDSFEAPEPKGAKVLNFPHKQAEQNPDENKSVAAHEFIADESPLEAIGILSASKQAELKKAAHEEYEKSKPDTLDLMLTERERFRDSEEKIFKQNGLASYQKNSDLKIYRVTETDTLGKEKTRITSVTGVLVDKKQA
ncbi:MAG: hypothetical protein K2P81_12625 [Bacteriovoracaceae bacterium]|nr:hypothetical protein [Bacteriovoracaceae bacterium]